MSKLRFGVIGAGGIADRRSIPGLLASQNCALSAVMDVVNADVLGRKYYVPHADNIDDVLARRDVDAVYVATPVQLHPAQVIAAAKAGKHVLCEKPLARTCREARPMIAACRKARVMLAEGYMMRFHAAHVIIEELIAGGDIGKPVFARAQLSCWYPKIKGAWRQDPKKSGGGALIDMATHLYDLLEMFLGPAARVACRADTLVQDYASEDAATTLIEFKSGAQAVVDTFFCIPDAAAPQRLEIYGSAGAIRTEGTIGQGSGGSAEIYQEKTARGYDAKQNREAAGYRPLGYPGGVNPYAEEFDALAESVAAGEKLGRDAEKKMLRPLAIAEAAYRSAKTGKFVDVDAMLKTTR
jgi:predicted dehydrogenase